MNPREFRPRDSRNSNDVIRVNHRIHAREVRVIGADGSQLGVMDLRKALEVAQSQGMDLAEVSPNSNPPVCKILDYGKFKYQQKKKAQAAKRNQAVVVLKEIQFRPQTDSHDIDFKVKHILRFLEEGNKVKATVRFRGRESAHADLGHALIRQIIEKVGEMAVIEQPPRLEGKLLSLIFAPNAKSPKKPKANVATTTGSGTKTGSGVNAAPET